MLALSSLPAKTALSRLFSENPFLSDPLDGIGQCDLSLIYVELCHGSILGVGAVCFRYEATPALCGKPR